MRLSSKLLMAGAALFFVNSDAYALSNFDYTSGGQASLVIAVSAEQNAQAEDFVERMAGDAIAFLGDESLSEDDKAQQFSKLLNRSFDMATIGRFALGKYWRVASPEQRDEYQSLFRDMIVEVYSRRFNEYNGQKLDVRGSRAGQNDDVTVNSYIIPPNGGQEVQVDWRVRSKNGQFKVVDVVVEGVSMALTQRSDFSSVIQRGGGDVAVLLTHLRKQQ